MIKYIYVENGKISITKAELEEMLKSSYNEGFEAAKILYGGSIQSYPFNQDYKDYITCNNSTETDTSLISTSKTGTVTG